MLLAHYIDEPELLPVRRLCRQNADKHVHATIPVVVVPGDQSPTVDGESYYWTTPSGKTRIMYPNAYRWKKVYHPSSYSVRVGFGWLAKRSHEFRKRFVLEQIAEIA